MVVAAPLSLSRFVLNKVLLRRLSRAVSVSVSFSLFSLSLPLSLSLSLVHTVDVGILVNALLSVQREREGAWF